MRIPGKFKFWMILRQLSALLFILAKTCHASSSVTSEIIKGIEEMSLTEKKAQAGTNPLPQSPLSTEEIFKQGEELNARTLNGDIESVVNVLNAKISELLSLGVPPIETAPIISCFENLNAEKLVQTAIREKAHSLLRILQVVYIWRSVNQFHWFKAISYENPNWYDPDLWKDQDSNLIRMNWIEYLWMICTCDNGDLAVAARNNLPATVELERFNRKILKKCCEYDSVKVFEAAGMEPSQLTKAHFELLLNRSSVKLIRQCQLFEELALLHFKAPIFPQRIPPIVGDFIFLMENKLLNFLPMNQMMERLCKEGKLDHLKHLNSLNPILIPNASELEIAAENNHLHILRWFVAKSGEIKSFSHTSLVRLVVNKQFAVLEFLMKKAKLHFKISSLPEYVASAGALEGLEWIIKKELLGKFQDHQLLNMANAAAGNNRFPVLKWLREKFTVLPHVNYLKDATIEILEWIQREDSTMINADLIEQGAKNFELLKWVFNHAENSRPMFIEKKKILRKQVLSKEMMIWFHRELEICPSDMSWAYQAGDIEAIEWAIKNCQILPTLWNVQLAARGGHIKTIRWIHEFYPEHLSTSKVLGCAIEWGNLEIAEYLLPVSSPKNEPLVLELWKVYDDGQLDVLEWIRIHGYDVKVSEHLSHVVSKRYLNILQWAFDHFPDIQFGSNLWCTAITKNFGEIYKWLLDNCPKKRRVAELLADIGLAFENGSLEVIRQILDVIPELARDASDFKLTRESHHIKEWIAAFEQMRHKPNPNINLELKCQ